MTQIHKLRKKRPPTQQMTMIQYRESQKEALTPPSSVLPSERISTEAKDKNY